jgi:hypothetical protein
VVAGEGTETEAVLWQPSGKATNLGALLGPDWTNTKATGINDLGDIVGYGHYYNGTIGGTFGFLLTHTAVSAIPGPVATAPELSTWAMLVVGFAGLGLVRYRGKRKGEGRAKAWPGSDWGRRVERRTRPRAGQRRVREVSSAARRRLCVQRRSHSAASLMMASE